jgi:hypothetical protein
MKKCQQTIPQQMASADAAQGTSSTGATGASGSQDVSCGDKSKSQMPQIPPMQMPSSGSGSSSPSTTPSPTAQTASTDTSCPTGQAADSSGVCQTVYGTSTDGGTAGTFVAPTAKQASATSSPSSIDLSGLVPSSTASAVTPPSSSGGAVSSGSSGFGGMNTSSVKKDSDAVSKQALAEGVQTGTAPQNDFGVDGGGGGMNSASADMSLADFLPGGKKDPTKDKNRKVAGATPAPAHPDIAGKDTNLFSGITKRMRLFCDMKELIGCN